MWNRTNCKPDFRGEPVRYYAQSFSSCCGKISSNEIWYWNLCCSCGGGNNKISIFIFDNLKLFATEWKTVICMPYTNIQRQIPKLTSEYCFDVLSFASQNSQTHWIRKGKQILSGETVLAYLPASFGLTGIHSEPSKLFVNFKKPEAWQPYRKAFHSIFNPIESFFLRALKSKLSAEESADVIFYLL